MKHLFYLPAFLAFATVSAYAQDAQTGQSQADPAQSQSPSTYGESQGDLSQSQGQSSQVTPEFSEADKDGDGYLSMEEAREALPQDVAIADTDGDGLLSKSEVESAIPSVSFEPSGESGADNETYIGEEEYDLIVQSIDQGSSEEQGV